MKMRVARSAFLAATVVLVYCFPALAIAFQPQLTVIYDGVGDFLPGPCCVPRPGVDKTTSNNGPTLLDTYSLNDSLGELTGEVKLSLPAGQLQAMSMATMASNQAVNELKITAEMLDQIIVSGPPGPVPLTVNMEVHASFLGGAIGILNARLDLFNSVSNLVARQLPNIFEAVPGNLVSGNHSETVSNLSPGNFEAMLSVTTDTVVGFPNSLFAQLLLDAKPQDAGPIVAVDASNTATLSIGLPPGYSFTSASGVLLTAPIPEPSTWLMLAGGLAIVVVQSGRLTGRQVC